MVGLDWGIDKGQSFLIAILLVVQFVVESRFANCEFAIFFEVFKRTAQLGADTEKELIKDLDPVQNFRLRYQMRIELLDFALL